MESISKLVVESHLFGSRTSDSLAVGLTTIPFLKKEKKTKWSIVSLDLILINIEEMIDATVIAYMERSSGLPEKPVSKNPRYDLISMVRNLFRNIGFLLVLNNLSSRSFYLSLFLFLMFKVM